MTSSLVGSEMCIRDRGVGVGVGVWVWGSVEGCRGLEVALGSDFSVRGEVALDTNFNKKM
eukprot:7806339-Prorocentrum_lima.AAC.1